MTAPLSEAEIREAQEIVRAARLVGGEPCDHHIEETEEDALCHGCVTTMIAVTISNERTEISRLKAEVRRLRLALDRFRGALQFYATENAYLYQGDIHLMGSAIVDRGNIARVTLSGGDPMGNATRALRRAKKSDAALREDWK